MSTLWYVRVLSLADRQARLEVRVAHPDSGPFSTSATFALRLLHEGAWDLDDQLKYRATAPLGEAVSYDEVLDDDWLEQHAGQFVTHVTLERVTGEPAHEGAQAIYHIEVSDPRWLAHLRAGQTWRSAAYS